MKLRLTVVYEIDEQEIWLERVFENLQPPAFLKINDIIELSYSENEASFRIGFFDWCMPENEVVINLDPCIKPKDHNEFWQYVEAFLLDDWKVCDGNTTYLTLETLRNKGYEDKIIV
jgi:hypothetical protein